MSSSMFGDEMNNMDVDAPMEQGVMRRSVSSPDMRQNVAGYFARKVRSPTLGAFTSPSQLGGSTGILQNFNYETVDFNDEAIVTVKDIKTVRFKYEVDVISTAVQPESFQVEDTDEMEAQPAACFNFGRKRSQVAFNIPEVFSKRPKIASAALQEQNDSRFTFSFSTQPEVAQVNGARRTKSPHGFVFEAEIVKKTYAKEKWPGKKNAK